MGFHDVRMMPEFGSAVKETPICPARWPQTLGIRFRQWWLAEGALLWVNKSGTIFCHFLR
jgi:hypothetical protein